MTILDAMWAAVRPGEQTPGVEVMGSPTLDSRYAVSEFASAALATAGLAADRGAVTVDQPLADAWFRQAVHPVGWQIPSPWDSLAGDYRTADGWIRLHTNAPHHRLAALLVLDVVERSGPRTGAAIVGQAPEPERDFAAESREERADVVAAVATRNGSELEAAIVEAGGAAAVLRSADEWAQHPQGIAVASEPLIDWQATGTGEVGGFRVLDLTRVIAGPVATRFLAGLGAEVLRIDPPDWDEPAIVADMTLGKRTGRLNVHAAGGLRKLSELIAQADVIVHGYRADALDRLGLTTERIAELRPGIIDVAIDAYGWSGPWRERRGFDSLVQMSTGIALGPDGEPSPLPVQALDHATGYLAAAAALEGMRRRRLDGTGWAARLSLARTALELPLQHVPSAAAPALDTTPLDTPWGDARLLQSPLMVGGEPLQFERGPRPLGDEKRPVWESVSSS
jgi:crotonobetainyl-CoA:carnitine CoA-transferase CaiB-like acyl-CoA transferase